MYATSISRLKTENTDPAVHHKNLLSDLKKDDGSLEHMFAELEGMRIDLFTTTIWKKNGKFVTLFKKKSGTPSPPGIVLWDV